MPHANALEPRPHVETLRPWRAFALPAIVFVLFSRWMGCPFLRDAASTRWPTTPAMVTASGTFACEHGHEATLSFAWTVDGSSWRPGSAIAAANATDARTQAPNSPRR